LHGNEGSDFGEGLKINSHFDFSNFGGFIAPTL